jgi:recombination protein RecR
MMNNPLELLTEQLSKLPGVGAKSAQRLAFFLISLPTSQVNTFASVIKETRDRIKYCKICFNISFEEKCFICANPKRVTNQICVVSEPSDIYAIEKTNDFKGLYHVLGGLISPIDGVHPESLRLHELMVRVKTQQVEELILAINPSIEGDATALYLSKIFESQPVQLSKLAHGLPMGADIDYADELTLQKAFRGRTAI